MNPKTTPGHTLTVVGFGRRFVAYLIDSLLLTVFSCTVVFFTGFAIGLLMQGREAGDSLVLQIFFNCLGLIISAVYFAGFWTATGQTPGKMAMGVKIIKTDGSPVSLGAALVRWIGYLISGLPLGLGFLWIAFDSRRQGWHDKLANTYVVPKDAIVPTGQQPLTVAPSDSGGAAVGMVLVVIVGLGVLTVGTIFILLLLGPVVGDVFSNVVEELERMPTPTP